MEQGSLRWKTILSIQEENECCENVEATIPRLQTEIILGVFHMDTEEVREQEGFEMNVHESCLFSKFAKEDEIGVLGDTIVRDSFVKDLGSHVTSARNGYEGRSSSERVASLDERWDNILRRSPRHTRNR